MSEKPYRVHKHTDNILDVIRCGNRHVLLITGSSDAYLIAQVLNKEITPMIEALDEKSLELMQANEHIAELEAALTEIANLEQAIPPPVLSQNKQEWREFRAIQIAKNALKKAGGDE